MIKERSRKGIKIPLINPKVIHNYGSWMLTPSRVYRHQSSQYHGEDMGEGYGKGKSSGPQRQHMKNHTSNERVSLFNASKPIDEEDIPQDLNEEREASRIFYKIFNIKIYLFIIINHLIIK